MNNKLFYLLICCTAVISCQKGKLPDTHYQARLSITSSNLSTGAVLVRFDDMSAGDTALRASSNITRVFTMGVADTTAGIATNVKLFKPGSTQPIVDTNLHIPKYQTRKLQVLYSEALGVYGFQPDFNVPKDSLQIQFSYNDLSGAYPAIDLCIIRINGRSYVDDVGIIVRAVSGAGLNPVLITLPCTFKGSTAATTYCVKLKDPVTGNFIGNGATVNFNVVSGANPNCGTFNIGTVNVDAAKKITVTSKAL